MSHQQPMSDVVVLIPGILGSVLVKDGKEIWGADSTVQASSSYAPTGKIERVEGGFKVSGRWSFSSGCDFCDWVILGGSTRNPAGIVAATVTAATPASTPAIANVARLIATA